MAILTDGEAKRRWRIWRIFTGMQRETEYGEAEVCRALGITLRDLVAKIERGEVEARRVGKGQWLVRWPEIALLAIEKWGIALIFAQLGENGLKALPPLVRPRDVTVTLPTYQVMMIQKLAARAGETPEAFLTAHFLDLAASCSEEMEAELPGFKEAIRWPEDV